MLQILQSIKSGELNLVTVPPPVVAPGGIIVRNAASLISAGTEKMLIELAQKNIIGKAQARPDLVKQIINKAKKEGLVNTFHNVMSKMEKPMPLGYSAAGIIESVGENVYGFKAGDRVAIAGAGYANHAEINYVPKNLAALIPDNVSFEEASYTTVASIALQGVRLGKPELGSNVLVIGLGLIGLITVQLLKANGCRVIGAEFDKSKIELALKLGLDEAIHLPSENALEKTDAFTKGYGPDYTFITAATKSNDPIEMAGELTRKKGQVIVVGAVGMNIPRDVYYKKELEIKVSMSYGPGRYDYSYEEGGIDYPYDYVRWTEQRNMQAVLDLISQKKLDVKSLTTHHFSLEKAMDAYALIQSGKTPYVGIVLDYDINKKQDSILRLSQATSKPYNSKEKLSVGFVGAGNYAALHLIPHLRKENNVNLLGLVTATGLNAQQKAQKFGFSYCTTDITSVIDDNNIDAVFIATRHSTHASYTVKALNKGKHVFVEKPMVISEEELDNVVSAYNQANEKKNVALMVGLNRRFAPMVKEIKAQFSVAEPKQMMYRVNSGHIPTTSWLHAPEEGGGMFIGEMCHFIDLMCYISGEKPVSVYARSMSLNNQMIADTDNVSVIIEFDKGSVGTLNYNTIGDKSASKERLEIYGGNKVVILDDFRRLEIWAHGKHNTVKAANQDKGQAIQVSETVTSFMKSGTAPIPFEDLVNVMKIIFAARRSVKSRKVEFINKEFENKEDHFFELNPAEN